MNQIYQELYNKDSNFFTRDNDDIPYYLVIGTGIDLEDLAIPVKKEYISNGKTIKDFLEEYILNEDDDSFLANLQLGNIVAIDIDLKQKLKNTFNQLKNDLKDNGAIEIYTEPLNFGPDWQVTGFDIHEQKIKFEDLIINNLMYIEINAPEKGYVDVKQFIASFKIKKIKILSMPKKIEIIGPKFGPIETPVIDYDPDKFKMIKIEAVKKRIEDRKRWLPTYPDIDLLYLIFAPIRFLRFKHSQGKLSRSYVEEGKTRPSIIADIRDNSLLGGVWEYKDLEFLNQIDLLISNKIIIPTDFNYHCPPYTTLYKVVKDGVLLVGDIEHDLRSSKEDEVINAGIKDIIRKPGHFITYTCMKKMGSEGTQVLIKYQNEIGTTGKMLTCKEMDMEMADMDNNSDMNIKEKNKKSNPKSIPKSTTTTTKSISPTKYISPTKSASRSMITMMSKNSATVNRTSRKINNSRPVKSSRAKKKSLIENDYRSQIYHDPERTNNR